MSDKILTTEEIREWKFGRETFRRSHEALRAERDAALARVAELEAQLERDAEIYRVGKVDGSAWAEARIATLETALRRIAACEDWPSRIAESALADDAKAGERPVSEVIDTRCTCRHAPEQHGMGGCLVIFCACTNDGAKPKAGES